MVVHLIYSPEILASGGSRMHCVIDSAAITDVRDTFRRGNGPTYSQRKFRERSRPVRIHDGEPVVKSTVVMYRWNPETLLFE